MGVTRVVVMGVAGSGKSTVARALARRLGARFVDGDDLHPPQNVAKMAAGTPLTDEDRWPWLAAVRLALRADRRVVVACSALTRAYRDALRDAEGVGFVHLVVSRPVVERRMARRTGHFMGTRMVASQFDTLEPAGHDETDVAPVDGEGPVEVVVQRAEAALATLEPGGAVAPSLAVGGPDEVVSDPQVADAARRVVDDALAGLHGGPARILLVPPDHTRLHGRAGAVTELLFTHLAARGHDVWVLPASGTHRAMTPAEVAACLGALPFDRVLRHRWREDLVRLGEISAAEVTVLSGGAMTSPLPVEVDRTLLEGWDLVVSIGQVVPHEVIGMANFTKNLVIGLGGDTTINGSHFLGALCDMEAIMGRPHTVVRDLVDAAFERHLAPRLRVLWVLTVVEETDRGVLRRGLFAGSGGVAASGGAAYRAAATLARRCNVSVVAEPWHRTVCWLDHAEFTTTWLANKAVYRTRMALADGAELVLLAPGVARFGEDEAIDRLIRRHGYRGTPATLDAVAHDAELARNLGAAAHLIHGSSEGRFTVVYCTDPADGGLTRAEVEAVGYGWRPLRAELDLLGVDADTPTGQRRDRAGDPFHHVARPALGLWTVAGRLG